jgi:quercetin dioxygenase-like cupin family protein
VIESADLYDFKGVYSPQNSLPATERVRFDMKVVNVKDQVQFKSEKMNKVSLFDSDRFFCDVYCLEPGQIQKVHAHEGSDKIYYLLEGKGKITIGSEEKELTAGEITMAPSGEVHGVVNHTQEPLVILVFMAPKPQ